MNNIFLISIDKKLSINRLTQRNLWIVSSFWNVSFRLFLEEQESANKDFAWNSKTTESTECKILPCNQSRTLAGNSHDSLTTRLYLLKVTWIILNTLSDKLICGKSCYGDQSFRKYLSRLGKYFHATVPMALLTTIKLTRSPVSFSEPDEKFIFSFSNRLVNHNRLKILLFDSALAEKNR